ncbi:putative F-box protein PP2-B12 [Bienertia sinuspersici]
MSTTNITDLPDECISHILSLTSPVDVLRSSAVSKQFLLASESNVVWNNFLPSNLNEIVSQASSPSHLLQLTFWMLDLFMTLSTREKCQLMLSVDLLILKIECNKLEIRFPKNARLLNVCWLLIEVSIKPTILSQNTTYGAYFVYKMDVSRHTGFESTPVNAYVYEFLEENRSEDPHYDAGPPKPVHLIVPSTRRPQEELIYARRDDGWMEIEMGRYYVHDFVDERVRLKMRLKQIEKLNWKNGLIVEGIELRPLD